MKFRKSTSSWRIEQLFKAALANITTYESWVTTTELKGYTMNIPAAYDLVCMYIN